MTWDQFVRTIVVLVIMASCYGWAVSTKLHWAGWADEPRARSVSVAILPILVLNGAAVVRSATLGREISWLTWSFLVAYLGLNAAMWLRFPLRKS